MAFFRENGLNRYSCANRRLSTLSTYFM